MLSALPPALAITMAATLGEQFVLDQAKVPGATGALSTVLNRISLAGRMIALEIMRAGFVGKLGLTGDINVQDEEVRALDQISNDIFLRVFANMHVVHALASEEMESIAYIDGGADGKYLVTYDPLDGSGNVDVDGPMGTIFSVLRRRDEGRRGILRERRGNARPTQAGRRSCRGLRDAVRPRTPLHRPLGSDP